MSDSPGVNQRQSVRNPRQPFAAWCSFPVIAALAFACMVYLWIPTTMADPDIWWHLRNAEVQFTSHAFLTHDLYSFTAHGAPWINHEWLAEVPFYLGWRLLGERGVFLVTVFAIETILLGVFYLAYVKSGNIVSAMIVSVVAAFISTVSFGPRTLLFGWICLVLELLLFERMYSEPRYVWALPVLFLFWVNLHGSWVIGFVLMLIFIVCTQVSIHAAQLYSTAWPRERRVSLIASCSLSGAALLLNPYGWRLVAYPFDLAFRQRLNIATVEEWKTLDFHSFRGKVFLGSIGLLLVLQLLKGARWTLYELSLVLIGVYASVTYSRFLFLGAILVMPILARFLFASPFLRASHQRGWLNILVALAFVFIIYCHFPKAHLSSEEKRKYPFGALNFLRQLPQGARVFNEFAWGGFIEWNVHELSVFIDSRVDIFEYNGTFRDYLDVIQVKDSLAILKRRNIQYVLFERDAPLTYLLEHSAEWKVAYQDGSNEVLEQTGLRQSGDKHFVPSSR